MFIRSPYNYDRQLASDASALHCEDESRAIQSAEEEANINTIVRRFGLTGELPNDIRMPKSGDFSDAPDFHTAMNLVREAQEQFMRMPAETRARFENDPGRFMAFFEDEGNRDEAKRLGLLADPVQPPEPVSVRVISDPPAE